MHEKVLPANSRKILADLAALDRDALDGWILAGGTGLALRLGHRISDDFDFFRTEGMDSAALHEALGSAARYETLQDSENTLTVLVDGVKVSFFQVRDPFIFDTQPYLFFSVADTKEIALMKLIAIANRGSRKDFIDLYTILRDGPVLRDYFLMLPEKYGGERINAHHILKSLTYFADAEEEPPPKMCEPFRWEECKAFFIRESHSIILGD